MCTTIDEMGLACKQQPSKPIPVVNHHHKCSSANNTTTSSSPTRRDKTAFMQRYRVGAVLGKGGFGVVYAGFRRADNLPVAIKHVAKKRIQDWSMINQDKVSMELKLLSLLQNVHGVINLIDYFILNDSLVYVMERPTNSMDLFNFITQKKYLTEPTARFLMRQVVETISRCHAKGIIHRDIKDENLLIDVHTGELKLIDFGAGSYLHDGEYNDFTGTRVYSPPELIQTSKYTADAYTVWSLGILLFDMVQGDIPFEQDEEICSATPKYRRFISDDCRDLIELCLRYNPDDRIKLHEILDHAWMCGEARYTSSQLLPSEQKQPSSVTAAEQPSSSCHQQPSTDAEMTSSSSTSSSVSSSCSSRSQQSI